MISGQLLEQSVYYKVQSDCLAAVSTANATARVTLFCAAQLASRLASELRDEVILADAEGDWFAYADALERVIRLADSEQSPQEIMWTLSASIGKIIPPCGNPG